MADDDACTAADGFADMDATCPDSETYFVKTIKMFFVFWGKEFC